MGVKNWIINVKNKTNDKVANLAALSPEQLEDVQKNRQKYLDEMPDPNDPEQVELTGRLLAANSVEIYNAYLPQMHDLYKPIQNDLEFNGKSFQPSYNIRYFNITKWVTDKRENSLEKLVNVYEVLSNENCNIALIFHRGISNTDVYLAVTNTENADSNTDVEIYTERLTGALKGNFPGSELGNVGSGLVPCLKNEKAYSVATATNIPTEKSDKFISQTIEKLLDGFVPENSKDEYTLILLATPIQDIEERKLRLSEFYSGLAPYAGWSTNFTYTESGATGSTATIGINVGASAGIQNGQNNSVTNQQGTQEQEGIQKADNVVDQKSTGSMESKMQGQNDSTTVSSSEGFSVTKGESQSLSNTISQSLSRTKTESDSINATIQESISKHAEANVYSGVPGIAGAGITTGTDVTAGGSLGTGHTDSLAYGTSQARSAAETVASNSAKTVQQNITNAAQRGTSEAITKATNSAIAKSVGHSVARTLGRAVNKSVATTEGLFKAVNFGVNFGANFARSSSVVATVGKNEGITQNYTNYNIKHTLELLEEQMKRYEQSSALGMWDFSAYILSENHNVANNVAHTYLALTQGEKSYMSQCAVNVWRGDKGKESLESKEAAEIYKYLSQLRHPLFGINPKITDENQNFYVYPPIVTATTALTGKELAYSLNFPQKSVSGLPVFKCAEFGRNVVTYNSNNQSGRLINLGKVFHMNHKENNSVDLSLESLKSHAFITGSTGSGKSNTIYHILNLARKSDVHFLVVEPAKGEYKNVFGNDEDVFVYGTNPVLTPLLRINPFSFPNRVHILEHLDRLVEIFNVCWPMYAAMPAVLKSAVERSYIDCGWDLVTSKNKYGVDLYPKFDDVARNIKTIIDSSEYDAENKGAYKGSLLTRLQSLTTGINGLIFTNNEISADDLFDKNVIIDLSRVGSSETKSLIMGMLVLKLQEFRMTEGIPMNADLRHLTVLEEAHNLLRRTSIEQPTESSNVLGKSVEMLANAIAEMRTYGEGFLIVDQAPGLMDMSVIRNTNTKIIMRLPDQGDRELVGKAASLNDDQIDELAKLPCGVAAVYQNEWIQPILCKIEEYRYTTSEYEFDSDENDHLISRDDSVSDSLLNYIMDDELFQKGDKEDLRELKSIVVRSGIDSLVKVDFLNYLETEKKDDFEKLGTLLYDLLKADNAIKESEKYGDIHSWINSVIDKLNPSIKEYTKKQIDLATKLILYEQMLRDSSYRDIYHSFTETYKNGDGVF